MIVGYSFPGDDNDVLKWVQHDVYGSSLGEIFKTCKRRYLAAVELTGVNIELADRIRGRSSFDHRVLQDAHDWIAARFRYKFDPAGQMPISFDGLSYEAYLEQNWKWYLEEEVRRLSEYDSFVLAILTAVAYENTDPGYQAEDALVVWLKAHYGPMDARRNALMND